MERNYRVFVAGGSGTIGIRLVHALVQSGYEVTALTRSRHKQQSLIDVGARPALADALDPAALSAAVRAARPSHIIHQLTALPHGGVRRARDLDATNRLRIEGTHNLLEAALTVGARRIVVGSFALLHAIGPEASPVLQTGRAALESMEAQVTGASRAGKIEAVVLRYGLFYGAGNPMTQQMISMIRRRLLPIVRGDKGLLPCVHLDDAVAATILALEHGRAGTIYDIVDDHPVSMSEIVRTIAAYAGAPAPLTTPAWLPRILTPYMAALTSLRVPLSNAAARRELGWMPRFPSWKDGLAQTLGRAA